MIEQLIGTWHLLEWDCTLDGEFHSHPFGRDAQGSITYTDHGTMSAILMKPNRPSFAIPILQRGTASEKQAGIDGYVSYAGRFRIEANRVIHTVEFSLLPNWIGTELIREIGWTYDEPRQLLLSTVPEMTRSGKLVVNRLRWGKRHTL